MKKSTFEIKRMDCSAEEQMIRMKLSEITGISRLDFNLAARKLEVYHLDNMEQIKAAISELNLKDSYIGSVDSLDHNPVQKDERKERKLLWLVLLINAFFFGLEIITGFISNSMGLVADSLDMLADALVYGLSLWAVGGSIMRKKNIAKVSGYLQLILAVLGFFEVIRRFMGYGETPVFSTMITISLLALMGNAASLIILRRTNSDDAHIKASQLFTSNDVIINIGVILAGILVYVTSSRIPDLIVGTVVFAIVIRGAFSIMKLAK
ncbi:cation transporter [Chryseobacterium lactis]|uniref:Cation transporter n=2 Tax=Chryseobacterium TaxID=59732 RepID=A0A3G6RSN2_CHRLC|nr:MULTISPECIES: cation transporter [Bacteroidota]ASE62085.1 cation transporter [Chryseobacterium indologenes]AZA84576.1 cation transporter [Chryseobacterium lactis]AZB04964.1 cation transporter [Chryseobacterium lactis]KMQ64439.1 cation transporter [Chryseobacterium angstadtii]MBF6643616.1 cation transporter [Chryseobacterium indologenes]